MAHIDLEVRRDADNVFLAVGEVQGHAGASLRRIDCFKIISHKRGSCKS